MTVATGFLGFFIKLFQPSEANMLFDGASLVLYVIDRSPAAGARRDPRVRPGPSAGCTSAGTVREFVSGQSWGKRKEKKAHKSAEVY